MVVVRVGPQVGRGVDREQQRFNAGDVPGTVLREARLPLLAGRSCEPGQPARRRAAVREVGAFPDLRFLPRRERSGLVDVVAQHAIGRRGEQPPARASAVVFDERRLVRRKHDIERKGKPVGRSRGCSVILRDRDGVRADVLQHDEPSVEAARETGDLARRIARQAQHARGRQPGRIVIVLVRRDLRRRDIAGQKKAGADLGEPVARSRRSASTQLDPSGDVLK